jgi:hypothetical protein
MTKCLHDAIKPYDQYNIVECEDCGDLLDAQVTCSHLSQRVAQLLSQQELGVKALMALDVAARQLHPVWERAATAGRRSRRDQGGAMICEYCGARMTSAPSHKAM